MIKTYDVIIEPHDFISSRNSADEILFKVFFEAIKESNNLGVNGYRILNFQLVDFGNHQARFHRQFIIEFEEVEPEQEKNVTPTSSKLLST